MSKLLELYLKLRELGHPVYLCEGSVPPISCGQREEEVDTRVQEMQLLLASWSQEVANLRSRYSWLLYFSVPKMLRLYRLISASERHDAHVDMIVHEVSFLAVSQPTEREELSIGVQVRMYVCVNNHSSA